jgi:hypothetical protein
MRQPVPGANGTTPWRDAPLPPGDRTVARHEAGHAVAAYWLKMNVTRLSIEPDGATFGRIVLQTSRRMLERIDSGILGRDARQRVENQVMTLLAGGIASGTPRGCELDHALAAALVLKLSGSVDEAVAYADWLRQRTTVLLELPPSRTAMLALTDRLEQRRILHGAAARAVVHQSFLAMAAGIRGRE